MIRIQGKIPRSIVIACSGGSDSMAVLDFLRRKHEVQVAFFHHRTEEDWQAEELIIQYCCDHRIRYNFGQIKGEKPKGLSLEEWWRDQRYDFFSGFYEPVVVVHHLDDCVETYLWSSFNGLPKIIPYRHGNVIRPFRLTRKVELTNWCDQHDVAWYEDPTNLDLTRTRNRIRHNILPEILKINPGIFKVISKKVEQDQCGITL